MICVECRREMIVTRNGVQVRWKKQTVRRGDQYECPKCGCGVVVIESMCLPYRAASDRYGDIGNLGPFLEVENEQ